VKNLSENLKKLRGTEKAIEMSKKYTGVTGVVLIRDEKGVERWLPKKAYMQMLEAGRKVTLLKELKTTAESQSELEREVEKARKEEQRVKEKLRREREEILNDMRKLIAELIEDENDAATTYKTLSEHARGLDLQNIERQFAELSRDEERHRIILRDIQSILSRTR
jgi:rubrerythrin